MNREHDLPRVNFGEMLAGAIARAFQQANEAILALTESLGGASAGFEGIGLALAEGLRAGFNDREYWRPRDDAPRVRPVGRRSNSRDWLAWDYRANAWRAVVRHQGGEWWWK